MSIYFAIAFGGSLGAISRYWVSVTTYHWLGDSFPYGTLIVNVVGSIAIGFLTIFLADRLNISTEVRLGLMVGFLGAFTTFSTFALDTVYLLDNGAILKAVSYGLLSVFLSILGVLVGIFTAKHYF
jgi:CrcB protein